MTRLFDMVVEDSGWYDAALETLVSIGVTPSLRANAEHCRVPIIRRLCAEAMKLLQPPIQLELFRTEEYL